MNSDTALIVGMLLGLGLGMGMTYIIMQMKQQNKKIVLGRNKNGDIDSIVETG